MSNIKPTTQTILDYVETVGPCSHKEIHEFYRKLNGSNSFSPMLVSLTTPWKNRPTRRYLVKMGEVGSKSLYIVKVATEDIWVTAESYHDWNCNYGKNPNYKQ